MRSTRWWSLPLLAALGGTVGMGGIGGSASGSTLVRNGGIGSHQGGTRGSAQTSRPAEAPGVCGSTTDCVGTFTRRMPRTCPLPPRDPARVGTIPPADYVTSECETDADCGARGYCIFQTSVDAFIRDNTFFCRTGCETDADCQEGSVCDCGKVSMAASAAYATLGWCRPGCASDAECDAGNLCITPERLFPPDTSEIGYWDIQNQSGCQSAADECWGPEDCPDPQDEPECRVVPACRPGPTDSGAPASAFVCGGDCVPYAGAGGTGGAGTGGAGTGGSAGRAGSTGTSGGSAGSGAFSGEGGEAGAVVGGSTGTGGIGVGEGGDNGAGESGASGDPARKRPGASGCGCRVPGGRAPSGRAPSTGYLALVTLPLAFSLRRRRQSNCSKSI